MALFPAASSTYSSMSDVSLCSNPSFTSASEIREIPTPTGPSQTGSYVTDLKQTVRSSGFSEDTSSLSGHGPVSSAPFPGRGSESKPGGMPRTHSLSSQDAVQLTSSEMKFPDIEKVRTTSNIQAHPAPSASHKSEIAEQQQSQMLSKSSETSKRLIGQSPSPDSMASKASISLNVPKEVASVPYVDQQETVTKSKVFEKTNMGHKQSETEETRKQSVQQSLSRTPTTSSSTTIEEESTHTVSQSSEVVHGTAPQGRLSLQGTSAWPTETSHQSELTSKIASPSNSAPRHIPQASCTQSVQQRAKSFRRTSRQILR